MYLDNTTRIAFAPRRRSVLTLCLATATLVTMAASRAADEAPSEGVAPRALAQQINRSAVDLYLALGKTNANLVFSPISVSELMAMLYEGARGRTATQIARVMHFDATAAGTSRGMSELLPKSRPIGGTKLPQNAARSPADSSGDEGFTVANSIWVQKDFKIRDVYASTSRRDFSAESFNVDFAANAMGARESINDWVDKRTDHHIPSLLDSLPSTTRFVAVNAVYFKGTWSFGGFPASDTVAADFFGSQGTVRVPMMSKSIEGCRYMESENLQAVELPYRGDRYSLVVVLPRARSGLPGLERGLTWDGLQRWLEATEHHWASLELQLPRFRIAGAPMDLRSPLESAGIKDAFSPRRADFSGIYERGSGDPLYLSRVVQRATIDVDEKGTIATAATGAVMVAKAAPADPIRFRADHPFLFLVRDVDSGAILFIGRLTDPVS
jgi:serpin B